MKKTDKKAAIGFIFLTLVIDITGWGIIIPVIPKLIKELIHGDISEAAKYGGWLTFAYAITQFLFAPLVGNLSDKFGRRPIILISLFAFSMDYLLLAFAGIFFLHFYLPMQKLKSHLVLQGCLIALLLSLR